jgi:hypothetical protein
MLFVLLAFASREASLTGEVEAAPTLRIFLKQTLAGYRLTTNREDITPPLQDLPPLK